MAKKKTKYADTRYEPQPRTIQKGTDSTTKSRVAEVAHKPKRNTWDPDNVWRAYDMSKSGCTDKGIAAELSCTKKVFEGWLKKYPSFRNAITKGREESETLNLFDGLELTSAQRRFLYAYIEHGVKKTAGAIARVTPIHAALWLRKARAGEKWMDYATAYDIAEELATDVLEAHARHRATIGEGRRKFYKGMEIMIPCEPGDHHARRIVVDVEDGVEKALYMKPYIEYEKSDRLLELLLKSKRREVFGDKKDVNLSGDGAGNNYITINQLLTEVEEGRSNGEPDIIDAEFVVETAQQFLEDKGIEPKKITKKKKKKKRTTRKGK